MENEKLKAIGAILHKLRAENERLREENARLRGQLTEEQRRIDAEDKEAFALVHREKTAVSVGCIHVALIPKRLEKGE